MKSNPKDLLQSVTEQEAEYAKDSWLKKTDERLPFVRKAVFRETKINLGRSRQGKR